MKTPTPAIVTSQAVRRLPKWSLLALCFVYVMAGTVGRDPWKSMDVSALGYMLSLAQGHSSLFHLQLAGIAPELDALIPYWLGAFSIQLLPFLKPDLAARMPFVLSTWIGMLCLWQAIYFLARNPQAQPVAFAFGGEAHPKDYSRSLADAGLLGYLACLGLAVPSHELTPMAFQLQTVSLLFMGSAIMPFHPNKGLIAWGLGLLLMALSGAPSLSLLIGAGTLWIWARHPQSTRTQLLVLAAIWLLTALICEWLDIWQWRLLPVEKLKLDWRQLIELLVWYLWPAWPLAAWTVWRWRAHWTHHIWSQHLVLPIFLFVLSLLASLLTENPDRTLLLTLPSLAALAAFAIPTFSRAASALVDWFTLLFFSTGALIVWVVWISLETGIPEQPALNVYSLVPGYTHHFDAVAFFIALLATGLWLKLIHWRVGRHPAALWKSMVLPASGTIVCWILLMTLWLPFLDKGLSYKAWALELHELTGPASCVNYYQLDRNQIAGLGYHSSIAFQPINTGTQQCDWLFVKANTTTEFEQSGNQKFWTFIKISQRPGDKKDLLNIYQRTSPTSHD